MAVYLVRQAEELGAAEARLGDLGLSALGRVQAKRTAGARAGLSLDRCVSSPLARALETARSLVAGRAIPLEVEPVFAEGSLGRLEGLSLEAAARAFPEDFRLGSREYWDLSKDLASDDEDDIGFEAAMAGSKRGVSVTVKKGGPRGW